MQHHSLNQRLANRRDHALHRHYAGRVSTLADRCPAGPPVARQHKFRALIAMTLFLALIAGL